MFWGEMEKETIQQREQVSDKRCTRSASTSDRISWLQLSKKSRGVRAPNAVSKRLLPWRTGESQCHFSAFSGDDCSFSWNTILQTHTSHEMHLQVALYNHSLLLCALNNSTAERSWTFLRGEEWDGSYYIRAPAPCKQSGFHVCNLPVQSLHFILLDTNFV